MEKIYVIEDDENIRNLLVIALTGFKYEAIAFENAEDALKNIEKDMPDMAIFDLMLPGMDGITAIGRVRKMPKLASIPIMILTAKDKELDKVIGLDGGADDYMVKPFGVLELGARIRSLLRRGKSERNFESEETNAESDNLQHGKVLKYREIEIDERRHEVLVNGKAVELTNKEYKLLCYLMERPTFVATRDELLNSIWGYDYDGESRTVDMHIKSLRQKIGDDGGEIIQTVRGVGYKLK
ncbi:MAG: response regulator transcription factor [Eubacteriales bacterium]|nr:response regulator transcription factor [Eubacteriales bacterium]